MWPCPVEARSPRLIALRALQPPSAKQPQSHSTAGSLSPVWVGRGWWAGKWFSRARQTSSLPAPAHFIENGHVVQTLYQHKAQDDTHE